MFFVYFKHTFPNNHFNFFCPFHIFCRNLQEKKKGFIDFFVLPLMLYPSEKETTFHSSQDGQRLENIPSS